MLQMIKHKFILLNKIDITWQKNLLWNLQVQTDFAPLTETTFIITIPETESINHAAVFLTGVAPLPAGTAGMVYWSWPDPAAPPSWQLLGHISNAKPSAIFKISNLKKLHELSGENELIDFNYYFTKSHGIHRTNYSI